MKQYAILARQNIIDPSTGKRLSDEGLWALDGIWKIPVTVPVTSENWHSIMNAAIDDFERTHPELHNIEYEMVEV